MTRVELATLRLWALRTTIVLHRITLIIRGNQWVLRFSFIFLKEKKNASSFNYFYDFENDIFYRQGKSTRQWFVYCISCQSKQCRIAFSRKIIYKSVMPPRLQVYNNRSKWSLRNIHSLSLYIQKQRKFLSVQHETRTSKHTTKLLNHVKQVK